MQLVLLVEPRMTPIPGEITVLRDFGRESVIYGNGPRHTAVGDSMILEGASEDFRRWLSAHSPVWTSKTPVVGMWELLHLKTEGAPTPRETP